MTPKKFAKYFICRQCQHRTTVYVYEEDALGGVSAECANKHKASVMIEMPDGGEEEE